MEEVQDNAQLGQEMPEIASNEALDFYHAFFDLFGFGGAREELERLMEAAFNEEYVSKHRCPAGLILFYEQMVQLVETAFARLPVYQQVAGEKKNKNDDFRNPKKTIHRYKRKTDNTSLLCITEPCSLSFRERQNPEAVFITFFGMQDLTEWKELLHQLMDAALSNNSIVVLTDPGILPASWVHLQKLIDVSYLLYTQSKQPTLKNTAIPKPAEDAENQAVESTEAPTEKRRFVKGLQRQKSRTYHE